VAQPEAACQPATETGGTADGKAPSGVSPARGHQAQAANLKSRPPRRRALILVTGSDYRAGGQGPSYLRRLFVLRRPAGGGYEAGLWENRASMFIEESPDERLRPHGRPKTSSCFFPLLSTAFVSPSPGSLQASFSTGIDWAECTGTKWRDSQHTQVEGDFFPFRCSVHGLADSSFCSTSGNSRKKGSRWP
jgi:hypothetical protein